MMTAPSSPLIKAKTRKQITTVIMHNTLTIKEEICYIHTTTTKTDTHLGEFVFKSQNCFDLQKKLPPPVSGMTIETFPKFKDV